MLVVVCSEFGRQLAENQWGGTADGEVGVMFLVGDGVCPGLCGKPCDLTRLHLGSPVYTTEFRRVYAAILDRWLDVEHESILPPGLESLSVLS